MFFCVFVAMEIKYDVRTVNALLDQFYDKRRLLILSAPNITDSDYQLQNIMIQVTAGSRHRHAVSPAPSFSKVSLPVFHAESRLRIRPSTRDRH